jgi:hypothetical protein
VVNRRLQLLNDEPRVPKLWPLLSVTYWRQRGYWSCSWDDAQEWSAGPNVRTDQPTALDFS